MHYWFKKVAGERKPLIRDDNIGGGGGSSSSSSAWGGVRLSPLVLQRVCTSP
jgi:hypothetical protein